MPKFLSGYRTYIVGWGLILKGAIQLLMPDLNTSDDPQRDIEMGLVALGLRAAIK